MIEYRFHGRGGQGVVFSCEILAKALLQEGKHVQYSPDFGTERRGAPVRAFVRAHDEEIYLRQQIYKPDVAVVFDTSVGMENVISGLKPGGRLLINSPEEPEYFADLGPFQISTLDANEIALRNKIGSEVAPVVNTAMLGATAKVMGTSLDALVAVTEEKFEKSPRNVLAVRDGYEKVKGQDKW